MRNIELIFPLFRKTTQKTQLMPGEKKLVLKTFTAKTLTIVLAKANHLKFNSITLVDNVILDTEGFDQFWIEKPVAGFRDYVEVSVSGS